MHLSAEQREAGKKNFDAAMQSDEVKKHSRRAFIKGTVASTFVASAGLGAAWFNYNRVDNPLRVGVIGTGDEGNVLMGAITPDYIQVVAIADIRPYNIHRAFYGDSSSPNAMKVRPGLLKKYDWKSKDEALKHVKVYEEDYRELLKNPDVEAVIIAVPLHLHAQVAVDAMRAGKHVLTEKLMGHSVAQCKEMSRISYQTGRLLATGHQRHYSTLYESAVELIRMGLLGKLHFIRAQWHRGNLPGNDSWQPHLPKFWHDRVVKNNAVIETLKKEFKHLKSAKGKAIKDDLSRSMRSLKFIDGIKKEWERLIEKNVIQELRARDRNVDAKKYGYQDRVLADGTKRTALEELIRWRLWNRTGGGLMAELGSHQLDAAGIFISAMRKDGKKVLPLTVTGVGGRHVFPEDRDCDDHVYCTYEYPGIDYYEDFDKKIIKNENKKVVVTYSSINGNGMGEHGEEVLGTKGAIILEKETNAILLDVKGGATGLKVKKGEEGPVLDTTASGAPEAVVAKSSGPPSRGYTEEMEHFAWCIRNFDQSAMQNDKSDYVNNPRCHPKVAMADAVIALTSNVAIKKGERITFKSEWFDIDKDETPDDSKINMKRYDR